jgi:hypothetical protein
MAAWRADGIEPTQGGFAERTRARIRNGPFHRPPRYWNEIEQLARERPHAEAGAERGGDLRQTLARIDLEAIRLLEPQDEPNFVQREHRQVDARQEHRGTDDPVLPRERRNEPFADRAA